MVKLYELRIGNFFEVELPPTKNRKIVKVAEIKQKQILCNGVWFHLDRLIPIALTEDVLLRSGFEKFKWITESNVFTHGDLNFKLDESGLQIFGADFNNLKPVQFLHDLQNLYSDLKEKELEVSFDEARVYKPEKEKIKERSFVVLSSNA